MALLTLTYLVSIRRSVALVNRITGNQEQLYQDEDEDDFVVEGEEDLIPKPEPLGGLLPPPRQRAAVLATSTTSQNRLQESSRGSHAYASPNIRFGHEKQEYKLPLDTDAAALRSKLIDADAAKRRAMARLAELERETENLRRRCAELERKSMVGESLHQLGFSQKFFSMAVPHLKAGRRGVMWKT